MDGLPVLIVELGAALCGPDHNRGRVVASFDALGVMFLANSNCLCQNSVELSWLLRRAPGLVKSASAIIGTNWQTEVPWAAAVLSTALHHGSSSDTRLWGMDCSEVCSSV